MLKKQNLAVLLVLILNLTCLSYLKASPSSNIHENERANKVSFWSSSTYYLPSLTSVKYLFFMFLLLSPADSQAAAVRPAKKSELTHPDPNENKLINPPMTNTSANRHLSFTAQTPHQNPLEKYTWYPQSPAEKKTKKSKSRNKRSLFIDEDKIRMLASETLDKLAVLEIYALDALKPALGGLTNVLNSFAMIIHSGDANSANMTDLLAELKKLFNTVDTIINADGINVAGLGKTVVEMNDLLSNVSNLIKATTNAIGINVAGLGNTLVEMNDLLSNVSNLIKATTNAIGEENGNPSNMRGLMKETKKLLKQFRIRLGRLESKIPDLNPLSQSLILSIEKYGNLTNTLNSLADDIGGMSEEVRNLFIALQNTLYIIAGSVGLAAVAYLVSTIQRIAKYWFGVYPKYHKTNIENNKRPLGF